MARKDASRIAPRGFFFSALCGTNAAIRKSCRANSILIAALSYLVGYTQAELQNLGRNAGAAFIPVSGDTIDLTDLSGKGYDEPTGIDEGGAFGEINVQTLNEYGGTVGNYFWYDYIMEDEDTGNPVAVRDWFDGDDVPVAKGAVTIPEGAGFWTFCDGDGYGLQSSGEVPTIENISVDLQNLGYVIANPTPVTVDLTDCFCTGYDEPTGIDEGGAFGEINVQTLNEYGGTVGNYFWYDYIMEDEDTGNPVVVRDWFDGDDVPVAKGAVTVEAGEGFWTFCDGDGYTFVWPKVTLAK